MYPVRRQALDLLRARRLPPLKPWEPHINSMRAMPWDIDPLGDLNNGRIMTLSDVGRITLAKRTGLLAAMKRRGWRIAMAGSTPQYRKRVTMWTPLEFHSRIIGLDHKFAYIEHTLYARGAPAANVMCRSVIVAKGKIVSPRDVAEEMGHADWNPDLPDWVRRWAEADDLRPWPPAPMA